MSNLTENMNLSVDPQVQVPAFTSTLSTGRHIGTGVNHWWHCHKKTIGYTIMVGLVVLLISYIINMMVIMDESSVNINIFDAAMHHGCRSNGGCCATCPFITSDDPRVVMKARAQSIETIYSSMHDSTTQDTSIIDMVLAKVNNSADSAEVKNMLKLLMVTKDSCINNVAVYRANADSIAASMKDSSKITTEVVNAKNRVTALEALASINAIAFASTMMQMDAYAKTRILKTTLDMDQKKIDGFDDKLHEAISNLNAMDVDIQDKMISFINSRDTVGSAYNTATLVLQTMTANSETIIGVMSDCLNTVEHFRADVQGIITKYTAVCKVYSGIMGTVEGFSNSLPNTLKSADIDTLIEDNDYNTALIKTALEPEIVTNHRKFAGERASFDSGGGVPSVRDDDNDLVPWVGLFGRPTYRHTDGSSADTGIQPLTSIPSTNPDDMMRMKTPRLSFV